MLIFLLYVHSLLTKSVLVIKREIAKMFHDLTDHNKIIANNILAQQYTAKLMLEI